MPLSSVLHTRGTVPVGAWTGVAFICADCQEYFPGWIDFGCHLLATDHCVPSQDPTDDLYWRMAPNATAYKDRVEVIDPPLTLSEGQFSAFSLVTGLLRGSPTGTTNVCKLAPMVSHMLKQEPLLDFLTSLPEFFEVVQDPGTFSWHVRFASTTLDTDDPVHLISALTSAFALHDGGILTCTLPIQLCPDAIRELQKSAEEYQLHLHPLKVRNGHGEHIVISKRPVQPPDIHHITAGLDFLYESHHPLLNKKLRSFLANPDTSNELFTIQGVDELSYLKSLSATCAFSVTELLDGSVRVAKEGVLPDPKLESLSDLFSGHSKKALEKVSSKEKELELKLDELPECAVKLSAEAVAYLQHLLEDPSIQELLATEVDDLLSTSANQTVRPPKFVKPKLNAKYPINAALKAKLKPQRLALPIAGWQSEILQSLSRGRVMILSGPTGSGKTTQVPQYIVDSGVLPLNAPCVLCTQPRRIAAITVAERVAQERGQPVGHEVGYHIRFQRSFGPDTRIIFCTPGILLHRLQSDPGLKGVGCVIIDEAHERDVSTDFTMLVLKQLLLAHATQAKLILMSATLQAQSFAEYFKEVATNCPDFEADNSKYAMVLGMPPGATVTDVASLFSFQRIRDIVWQPQQSIGNMAERRGQWKVALETSDWEQLTLECAITEYHGRSIQVIPVVKDPLQHLGIPWVQVEGRSYPVTAYYLEDVQQWLNSSTRGSSAKYYAQLHADLARTQEDIWLEVAELIPHLMPEICSCLGMPCNFQQILNVAPVGSLEQNNLRVLLRLEQPDGNIIVVEVELMTVDGYVALKHLCPVSPPGLQLACLPQPIPGRSTESASLPSKCRVDSKLVAQLVQFLHASGEDGSILVFLPGISEIDAVRNALANLEDDNLLVLRLHSALSPSEQQKAFTQYPGRRKVLLSTNIAESSVTVEDVVFVIDSGLMKENNYSMETYSSVLDCTFVSQVNVIQRRGRAGRVRPGIAIHLFSKDALYALAENPTPEICRTPLEELTLQVLALGIPNVCAFLSRAMDPPPPEVVDAALWQLEMLQCIKWRRDATDEDAEVPVLLPLGRVLSTLPIHPQLGRMVMLGALLGCLDDTCTIAATLCSKSPFIIPEGGRLQNEMNRVKLALAALKDNHSHPGFEDDEGAVRAHLSDHLAFLNLFEQWSALSPSKRSQFCYAHFVNPSVMNSIKHIRGQLIDLVTQMFKKQFKQGNNMRSILNRHRGQTMLVRAVVGLSLYPNIAYLGKDEDWWTLDESEIDVGRDTLLWEITIPAFPNDPLVGWCCPSAFAVYHSRVMKSFRQQLLMEDATVVGPLLLLLGSLNLKEEKIPEDQAVLVVDDNLLVHTLQEQRELLRALRDGLNATVQIVCHKKCYTSASLQFLDCVAQLVNLEPAASHCTPTSSLLLPDERCASLQYYFSPVIPDLEEDEDNDDSSAVEVIMIDDAEDDEGGPPSYWDMMAIEDDAPSPNTAPIDIAVNGDHHEATSSVSQKRSSLSSLGLMALDAPPLPSYDELVDVGAPKAKRRKKAPPPSYWEMTALPDITINANTARPSPRFVGHGLLHGYRSPVVNSVPSRTVVSPLSSPVRISVTQPPTAPRINPYQTNMALPITLTRRHQPIHAAAKPKPPYRVPLHTPKRPSLLQFTPQLTNRPSWTPHITLR